MNAAVIVDKLLETDIDDPREFMQRNVPEFGPSAIQKVLRTYFSAQREYVCDCARIAWWYPNENNPYRIALGFIWEYRGASRHDTIYLPLKSIDGARRLVKDLKEFVRCLLRGKAKQAMEKSVDIQRNAAKDDYGDTWP